MAATTHHVFLIPGFFGFVNFGRVIYFSHVREILEDAFARTRTPVEIHRVGLQPTASLRVRAAQLHRTIHEAAPANAPIHLVGHSTGGLDARLLTTPGLALEGEDVEACARRVRSVVTIATPHRGTPLAGFFSSLFGQQMLRLLSLSTIAILRRGRLPAAVVVRATAIMARVLVRRSEEPVEILAELERYLVNGLAPDERDLIAEFVRDVGGDQSLIPQLAPEAMDLFDATTANRPTARYACVTARATPASLRARLGLGLDPWAQLTYGLYAWLDRRVGEGDGIVPLASQRRGTVLYEARGDHLDVIGHFDGPKHKPPHVDWLHTRSRFDRAQFEDLWERVARFIAQP